MSASSLSHLSRRSGRKSYSCDLLSSLSNAYTIDPCFGKKIKLNAFFGILILEFLTKEFRKNKDKKLNFKVFEVCNFESIINN